MSLLSLILVFVLEQLKPLDYARRVQRPFAVWAGFLEKRCNAGGYRHGVLAAVLAIAVPATLVGLLLALAYALGGVAILLVNVAVLYCVMGFRQFSHFYTDIQVALRLDDSERARELLAAWRQEKLPRYGAPDIARLSIETALADAHRHVFAVLLWFVALGPVGAVVYRLSHLLSELWPPREEADPFGEFARQLFAVVDWLPARATAAAFAVVGNFEDAVYCWRRWARLRRDDPIGIVLASGGGALGVRLGVVAADRRADEVVHAATADVEFMQSAIGLVWRAIVLWLLALFVLGLVRLTS